MTQDTWSVATFELYNDSAKVWQNGTLDISYLGSVIPGRLYYVGSYVNGSNNPFNGSIAELLAFDHPLSTSERQPLEQYLMQKYLYSGLSNQSGCIVCKSGGYGTPGYNLVVLANGSAMFSVSDGTFALNATSAQLANQWDQVTGTLVRNDTAGTANASIYVNGVLSGWASGAMPGLTVSTNPLLIGNGNFTNAGINATIDDVAYFNNTLTAAQISAMGLSSYDSVKAQSGQSYSTAFDLAHRFTNGTSMLNFSPYTIYVSGIGGVYGLDGFSFAVNASSPANQSIIAPVISTNSTSSTGVNQTMINVSSVSSMRYDNVTLVLSQASVPNALDVLNIWNGSTWVTWSGFHNFARTSRCDGVAPNYTSLAINNSYGQFTWYACTADTNGDNSSEYYRIVVPILNSTYVQQLRLQVVTGGPLIEPFGLSADKVEAVYGNITFNAHVNYGFGTSGAFLQVLYPNGSVQVNTVMPQVNGSSSDGWYQYNYTPSSMLAGNYSVYMTAQGSNGINRTVGANITIYNTTTITINDTAPDGYHEVDFTNGGVVTSTIVINNTGYARLRNAALGFRNVNFSGAYIPPLRYVACSDYGTPLGPNMDFEVDNGTHYGSAFPGGDAPNSVAGDKIPDGWSAGVQNGTYKYSGNYSIMTGVDTYSATFPLDVNAEYELTYYGAAKGSLSASGTAYVLINDFSSPACTEYSFSSSVFTRVTCVFNASQYGGAGGSRNAAILISPAGAGTTLFVDGITLRKATPKTLMPGDTCVQNMSFTIVSEDRNSLGIVRWNATYSNIDGSSAYIETPFAPNPVTRIFVPSDSRINVFPTLIDTNVSTGGANESQIVVASLGNDVVQELYATYASPDDLADNASAIWHFYEGIGTVERDSSLNGHLLTFGAGAQAPLWNSNGAEGSALSFGGSRYAYSSSSALDLGSNFTVTAWIKANATGTQQFILGRRGATGSGYALLLNANGRLSAYASDGASTVTAQSNANVSDNTWHHVAAVFQGQSGITIYVDGALSGSATGTFANVSSTADFTLGRDYYSSPVAYFGGMLDEVKLQRQAKTLFWITSDATFSKSATAINSSWVGVGYLQTDMSNYNGGNDTTTMDLNLSIPNIRSPGSFYGYLAFNKSQGNSILVPLSITVPQNVSWHLGYTYFNMTVSQGANVSIDNLTVYNDGNSPLNFSISYGPAATIGDLYPTGISPSFVFVPMRSAVNLSYTFKYGSIGNYPFYANFSNATADPALSSVTFNITVADRPPAFLDAFASSYSNCLYENRTNFDVNSTIYLCAIITDDRQVNLSASYSSAFAGLNASPYQITAAWKSQRNNRNMTAGAAFNAPMGEAAYSFNITAFDSDAFGLQQQSNTSANRIFYTSNKPSLRINVTPYNQSIDGVTATQGQNITVSVTVNNTGFATARNLTILFSVNNPVSPFWQAYVPAPITLSPNGFANLTFNITVGKGELSDVRRMDFVASYLKPDNSGGSSPSQSVFVYLNGTADISLENVTDTSSVNHGTYQTGWFVVRNIGNVNMRNVNISCYTPACGNITFAMNSTKNNSFVAPLLAANNAYNITYNISVPLGFPYGTYTLGIKVDPNLTIVTPVSRSISLEIPEDTSWHVAPLVYTIGIVAGASSSIGDIVLYNDGNAVQQFQPSVDTSFSLACSSDPNSLCIQPNDVITLAHGNATIPIVYRAPAMTKSTTLSFHVDELSRLEENIVNMTFNSFSIDVIPIAPQTLAQQTDIVPGTTAITTQFNASLGGLPLDTNVSFKFYVNNTECIASSSPSFFAGLWSASCTAPVGASQEIHRSFTIQTTYSSSYGVISVNKSIPDALVFRDVWAPQVVIPDTSDVPNGTAASVTVDVSDNVNVSSTSIAVMKPDGSTAAAVTSNSSQIILPVADTSQIGDYEIIVTSTDVNGNQNITRGRYIEAYTLTPLDQPSTAVTGEPILSTLELYRPVDGKLIHDFSENAGWINQSVHVRTYDAVFNFSGYSITLKNATINFTTDKIFDQVDLVPPTSVIVPDTVRVLKAFSAKPGVGYANASLWASYLDTPFSYEPAITLYHCVDWNYSTRVCSSNWTRMDGSRPDVINRMLYRALPGFSAYAIAEDLNIVNGGNSSGGSGSNGTGGNGSSGGNGTSGTGSTGGTTTVYVGGGSSGGSSYSGGISAADLSAQLDQLKSENSGLSAQLAQQISNITAELAGRINNSDADTYRRLKELLNATQSDLGITTQGQTVYLELFSGEATQVLLQIKNTLNRSSAISATPTGQITDLVSFEQSTLDFASGQERNYRMIIRIPAEKPAGLYYGDVVFKNDQNQVYVPVNIRVLPSKERLLDLKIQPLVDVVAPGTSLKNEVSIYNLGETTRVDVQLKMQLLQVDNEAVITEQSESIAIDTTLSVVKSIDIPENLSEGKYLVRAVAYYSNDGGRQLQAASIATIRVQKDLFSQTVSVFGIKIPVVAIIVFVVMVIAMWALYIYQKAEAERKKRYLEKVDFTKLPRPGERSGFVGVIAETKVRTFIDLDRLQMHTLIAGASGSGKTVAAQVIIEEALMKGVSVMLFDPTAQWTGFLRAQKNPKMISLYPSFGMKRTDIRAFPGNIIYVEDPNMVIDVKRFMKAGEVTVFVLTKLQIKPRENTDGKPEPSTMEVFVSNTIQRIFEANLDESPKLRLLLVYDEVHRLLPKFGGSGLGFTQIERGAREFRKWGLGLVLISQVLSDFVGEIKANIGTEIQMRTKYEGDLERVKLKFGEDTLRSIVKASIGTGMMHSAEYNNGLPYFVTFRPLLHDVVRLSDDELAKYAQYNAKIDKTAKRLDLLKNSGADVFDLELELDLARDKLKKGSFNLVDVYLEGVEQRVGQLMDKYGISKEKF